MDTEFIKLSNYKFAACRACIICAPTNVCVLKDDATELIQKVKDADAIFIGGYTPHNSLDGWTKSFIERFYCLHHQKLLLKGKLGGIVITSAIPQQEPYPPVAEMGVAAVKAAMDGHGIKVIGDVKIVGDVPCMKCGFGEKCEGSGVKLLYGPDAKIADVGFHSFENQSDALKAAQDLGERIAKELRKE